MTHCLCGGTRWRLTHSWMIWLNHMCTRVILMHTCYDLFMLVPYLIYMCHDSFMSRFTNVRLHAPESQIDWRICAWCHSLICAHDSFFVSNDMCIGLTNMCVCATSWLNLVSHLREGTCVVSNETMTHTCMTWNETVTHACITWLMHLCTCAISDSYLPWLIHVSAMSDLYMPHD